MSSQPVAIAYVEREPVVALSAPILLSCECAASLRVDTPHSSWSTKELNTVSELDGMSTVTGCFAKVSPTTEDHSPLYARNRSQGEVPLDSLTSQEVQLMLADDGEGGTYFVRERGAPMSPRDDDIIAVFKPAAEEIGCSGNPRGNVDERRVDGFEPGTGACREVAAKLLDHENRAHVPDTIFTSFTGKGVGSLQRYIPGLHQSWNMSPAMRQKMSLADLQSLALFDIRVMNTDRHGGNILIHPTTGALFAIDHSFILPPRFVDPEWDWLSWPESKAVLLPGVRQFFQNLDDDADFAMLTKLDLDEDSLQLFKASSMALKMILTLAPSNVTLAKIAEFFRRPTIACASPFEECVADARESLECGGKIRLGYLQSLLRRRILAAF